MDIQSLDHLVLTVKDIEASIAFYCDILGMQHITFGPGTDNKQRHALKFGSQKINLHQAATIFQPAANTPTPGSTDLCFIVKTPLAQVIHELEKHNIKIIEGPVERTGATNKISSVYVRDPDLNLIELSNL